MLWYLNNNDAAASASLGWLVAAGAAARKGAKTEAQYLFRDDGDYDGQGGGEAAVSRHFSRMGASGKSISVKTVMYSSLAVAFNHMSDCDRLVTI